MENHRNAGFWGLVDVIRHKLFYFSNFYVFLAFLTKNQEPIMAYQYRRFIQGRRTEKKPQ